MATEVYLGEPPAYVKEWIKNHKQNQFNFLYKTEDDIVWQEYEPSANDIQDVGGNVTIAASDFTNKSWFGDVREVKLPNKWNNGSENVDVTSIGNGAFYGRNKLTSVTIPDTVTSIGGSAFQYCSGLTNVTIPESVTDIWDQAFLQCSGLTSVTIPNGVTTIRSSTFSRCSGLTSVTIPNGVTTIGPSAFSYCSMLASVEFEGNAPTVGFNAFANVASGCKAIISSTATGFPAPGETWHGLIVEWKQ